MAQTAVYSRYPSISDSKLRALGIVVTCPPAVGALPLDSLLHGMDVNAGKKNVIHVHAFLIKMEKVQEIKHTARP